MPYLARSLGSQMLAHHESKGLVGNRHARCGACGQAWVLREELWGPGMACPACGTPVPETALLGQYQVVRRLDTGGLGDVFEAIDSVISRTVAIKTLRHGLFRDPGFIAQFAREADVLGALAHPNIAGIFEFFPCRGTHCLVMEFLPKGNLLSQIRQHGPLSESDLLRVGMDAVRGLAAALEKGLLHRDVKPANILFDAQGRAKLADFGLSVPLEQALAMTGPAWGSPYYIPPERIEGRPEDFRGDMYSLGVTLFHAAAGRTPFQATSASVMAWKHLKAQHVSVKTFARHLSEPTSSLINRCMERRPEDRFRTYFELLDALESARKELVFAPPTPKPPPPDLIGASGASAWTFRWLGAGAISAVLIAGIILALRTRDRGFDIYDTFAEPAAGSVEPGPASTSPQPAGPAIVRFTEAEGYREGTLAHPEWVNRSENWTVAPGGGRLIHGPGEGPGIAVFRRPFSVPPGSAIRGKARFRFWGPGSGGGIVRIDVERVGFVQLMGAANEPPARYALNLYGPLQGGNQRGLRSAPIPSDELFLPGAAPRPDAETGTTASCLLEIHWSMSRESEPARWRSTAELLNLDSGSSLGKITSPPFDVDGLRSDAPDAAQFKTSLAINFPGRVEVLEWEVSTGPPPE